MLLLTFIQYYIIIKTNNSKRQVILLFSNKSSWKVTPRDMDILEILWNSEKSLTALEIVHSKSGLTMNTVQAVLRKLLGKNVIEVAEIVYSGTVLSRSYKPSVSQEEFLTMKFSNEINRLHTKISKSSLVSALLDTEEDPEQTLKDIKELELMLEEYKKTL
jgi:predicted transcriptional regulator